MPTQGVIPKAANFIPVMGGVSSATDTGASARPFQYHPDTRGITVHIVGGTVSVDTTGLATEAKQDDIITAIEGIAAGGDATAANQVTIIGHLDGVEGSLTTITGHVDGIEALLGGTLAVSNAGLTELAAAINASSQMDVNIAANGIGLATAANQTTIIGHVDGIETLIGTTNTTLTTIDGRVDGIEGLLTTIDADTGNIDTSLNVMERYAAGPGGATAVDSYTHAAINLSAAANQSLVAAPGANKQIWVYGIGFVLSVAGSVSIQTEDDVAITGVMPFAANSGLNTPPTGNFAMPIWKVPTNKALEVDLVTADMDGWIDYAIVSV
jgi:hypothetical protein